MGRMIRTRQSQSHTETQLNSRFQYLAQRGWQTIRLIIHDDRRPSWIIGRGWQQRRMRAAGFRQHGIVRTGGSSFHRILGRARFVHFDFISIVVSAHKRQKSIVVIYYRHKIHTKGKQKSKIITQNELKIDYTMRRTITYISLDFSRLRSPLRYRTSRIWNNVRANSKFITFR